MKGKLIVICAMLPILGFAKDKVTFDGFADFYYAYDFNTPKNKDRAYTTQPARHDEFNLNLAMFGMTLERNKLKTRISFQAGTYVQSNYSAEPSVGNISGSDLSRHIQDGYLTYQVTEHTSFIVGIFPSHIGYESVLSIDNYTYTRSLAADFSPYYQSGAGVVHNLNENWKIEGYIINGWQNISEDDSNKAIGSAIRYTSQTMNINYSNYFGKYLGRSRSFHDINIEYILSDRLSVKGLFDFGVQKDTNDKTQQFYTANLQGKLTLNNENSVALRLEHYNDPKQANIINLSGNEFKVSGGSFGYDFLLEEKSLLRLEYRYLKSTEDTFTKGQTYSDENQLFVASIAARF